MTTPPEKPDLLLHTELFPPFVGGSAVLFDNVYSRVDIAEVPVLTDFAGSDRVHERRGRLRIRRGKLAARRWGVLHPASLAHHCHVVSLIRSTPLSPRALVHCGRALPEGLQALWATWASNRGYLCWTHGEELAYARTSRELTFLMKRVHRHAVAVIANSHHTADLLEAFGVQSEKIHVVHPGVDAGCFRPSVDAVALRRRLAGPGEVMLLSIGRLQRRKGHDLVIASMSALRHRTPRLRYIIVGDGDERARLEALVREYELQEYVTFEGQVEAGMLPAYYAACDVFVMPNRVDGVDVEGFGIVFLEAAAAGRPTIGGRSGGVPEAVEEPRTGLLVGGTDVNELTAAITKLAASDSLRRQMGQAGRQRVLERFSWDRAAADVTTLQRTLFERQP